MDLAQQLMESVDSLDKLFNVYNDKTQWRSAYPLLVDAATRIEETFHANQHVSIATLAVYNAKYSYATNLISRQCILICIFAKISGLNRIACVKLLQSAISHCVSISNELNCVAAKTSLNANQHERYKNRYRYTYQFVKPHLSKLPLLQTDLVAKIKQQPHYSIDNRIVRLSYVLAKAITCVDDMPARTLRDAIHTVYLKTTRTEDKSLLTELGQLFNNPLPGETVRNEGLELRVLGQVSNNKLLCYHTDSKSFKEVKTSARVIKHRVAATNQIESLIGLWQKLPELVKFVNAPHINEYFTTHDLHVIRKAAHFSIGKLLGELAKNPNANTLVLNLAQRFSNNPISDIRHAIALVGIEQLPDLLENQQLLQRLRSLGKLNWHYVENRVSLLIAFIESYKIVDPHFPCQKVINYALKYIAFTFKLFPHGIVLPINTTTSKHSITDINSLVNFYALHNQELPDQVKANPFFEISQSGYQLTEGTEVHSACFVHLVICNLVYLGQTLEQQPAHIKQQMIYAQQQLQIENLDNYLTKLLDFSPVNRVL